MHLAAVTQCASHALQFAHLVFTECFLCLRKSVPQKKSCPLNQVFLMCLTVPVPYNLWITTVKTKKGRKDVIWPLIAALCNANSWKKRDKPRKWTRNRFWGLGKIAHRAQKVNMNRVKSPLVRGHLLTDTVPAAKPIISSMAFQLPCCRPENPGSQQNQPQV